MGTRGNRVSRRDDGGAGAVRGASEADRPDQRRRGAPGRERRVVPCRPARAPPGGGGLRRGGGRRVRGRVGGSPGGRAVRGVLLHAGAAAAGGRRAGHGGGGVGRDGARGPRGRGGPPAGEPARAMGGRSAGPDRLGPVPGPANAAPRPVDLAGRRPVPGRSGQQLRGVAAGVVPGHGADRRRRTADGRVPWAARALHGDGGDGDAGVRGGVRAARPPRGGGGGAAMGAFAVPAWRRAWRR